jgi:NAD(P)-dependent dehydrogenase (short-subunit alcohol dehydrogenase family)
MISEGFVRNGATVYISSRDAKACEQACKELNALGKGRADYIAADLYKEDAAQSIADELKKRAGSASIRFTFITGRRVFVYVWWLTVTELDVLVNNSGSNWGESYDTYPSAAWDRVLDLNLKRVFQITQAVTPLLEAASTSASPARIINIGSVDGLRVPALETFAYSASKAGLHHLSRVLASHLGKRGITSNTIACGPFQSKMMKATLEKFKDVIEGGIPLGRIGSPEDVAGTCIWLSSRAGAYVNGATIALDGGSVVGAKL